MKNIITIFILAILINSCHNQESDNNALVAYDIAMEKELLPITRQQLISPTPPLSTIKNEEEIKKKIIKDGRIGVEVQELENTKRNVDTLVAKYGGYYASENLNNSDWETSYSLKIRIPSIFFEQLILEIESGRGEIKYKEIDARDVTGEFIDLEIRLENKKNYLKRYRELLKKAKTVKDILEIEEKIRGIEEEIASTTGRLKYLSDLVDYSTLNLEISKPKDSKYEPEKRDVFSKRLKYAWSKGWFGFIDFVVFAVKVWPFWIMVTLIIYGWRKFRKKKKNNI